MYMCMQDAIFLPDLINFLDLRSAGSKCLEFRIMYFQNGCFIVEVKWNVLLIYAHFPQCLSIAIEQKDKGTEGRMYCSMGNCLRAIVEIQRAEECYYRVSLGIRLVGDGCCLFYLPSLAVACRHWKLHTK